MKKRVLFITNGSHLRNGWAVVGINLVKRLSKKYDLTSLETKRNSPSVWINLAMAPLDILRFVSGKPRKYDVIVCNLEPALPLATILRFFTGAKHLVLIAHGTYAGLFEGKSFQSRLMRLCAKKVSICVVPSEYTESILSKGLSLPTRVVYWGVDVNRFHPLSKPVKNSIILFASPPKKRKGWSTALRALALVRKKVKNARMIVVSPSSESAISDAKKHGVMDYIEFTGRVSDEKLVELYQTASVHLLPCVNVNRHFDGFGLVHLQASACGVPTIGSIDCGNESAISEGISGYLCKQKDHNAIAHHIVRLLQDSALRESFHRSARSFALSNSWDVCVKNFEAVIDDLDKKSTRLKVRR